MGDQRADVLGPAFIQKLGDIRRVNGLGAAAPGVAGEKGEGVRSQRRGPADHGGIAAGGGNMITDPKHMPALLCATFFFLL